MTNYPNLQSPEYFSGSISAVTRDGRFGIVVLDCVVGNCRLAVISNETVGRIALMNLGKGQLQIGMKVEGTGIRSSEAIRAATILCRDKELNNADETRERSS